MTRAGSHIKAISLSGRVYHTMCLCVLNVVNEIVFLNSTMNQLIIEMLPCCFISVISLSIINVIFAV